MGENMSIRKPSNSSASSWLTNTFGQNQATSTACNSFDWDVFANAGYHLSPASKDDFDVTTTKVETPDWVDVDDGYDVEVFRLETGFVPATDRPMVAMYRPRKTLSVGFVRIYFVDGDSKPFPQMVGVWNEILLRPPYNGHICGCVLDERGRLSGAFGIPDTASIYTVASYMYAIYESWRHFPNESSFDMVKRLYEAIVDVKAMQKELGHKITVPQDCQLAGALGAALFAWEDILKEKEE